MTNLNDLKTTDLRAIARDLGINDWWNLKKAELIKEIESAEHVDVIVPEAPEEVEADDNVNTKAEEENVLEEPQESKKKNQKRLIDYNGKTQTLTAWAKELGIRHQTLYNRIVMKGWDVDRAFEAPTKKENKADAENVENK